jgi:group I intron endonuclease
MNYIYKYIELATNRTIYVGQTNNPEKRHRSHINGKKQAIDIYMKKNGITNFKFEVIAECKSDIEANRLEIFWIKELKTHKSDGGLNIDRGGINSPPIKRGKDHYLYGKKGKDVPSFGRTHTEEAKKLISEANKGKNIGEDNPFFGKTHSEETLKLISEANKGKTISEENKKAVSKRFKGIPKTEEQRKKMSITRSKSNFNIRRESRFTLEQVEEIKKLKAEDKTQRELAIIYNCGISTIGRIIHDKLLSINERKEGK